MFLCKKCHEQDIKDGCPNFHPFTSHGKCEGCDKVRECVDCKFYKTKEA